MNTRLFFVLLLAFQIFSLSAFSQLDVAQIALVNDVDDVRYATRELEFDRLEPIRFFQWESVTLDVTALHGETPAVLTNDDVFLRWEAYENEGDTNAPIYKVGTVVDASAGQGRVTLTPSEAGLPAGEYYSYVRAFQPVDGDNVYIGVVAYNRLIVKWAPNPSNYTYAGPYSSDELTEVGNQVSEVSNRVDAVEADLVIVSNAAMSAVQQGGTATNLSLVFVDSAATVVVSQAEVAVCNGVYSLWVFDGEYNAYTNANGVYIYNTGGVAWLIGTNTPPDVTESGVVYYTTAEGDGVFPPSGVLWFEKDGAPQTTMGVDLIPATDYQGDFVNALGLADVPENLLDVSNRVDGLESSLGIVSDDFQTLETNVYTIAETDDLISEATPVNYAVVSNAALNAIQQNAPISVTNDSIWTGWTTTGDLTASNTIYMTTGEMLLSPVQTNGIADYTVMNLSGYEEKVFAMVGTNVVDLPYFGTDAQLQIEMQAVPGIPGVVQAINISRAVIVGITDLSEAAQKKYVSSICRVTQETDDCDLTSKIYVDEGDAASVASAAASLTAYAADADKTVICSRLRLGEEYSVEGSGDLWQLAQFCALDGAGELVASEDGLSILKNGRVLLSSRSDVSGVFITNYNFTAWTFDVATNGVTATPFLEFSPSLTVQDWTALPDEPVLTNDVYAFTVADPPTNLVGYVRAVQPIGTSAIIINADSLEVQGDIINTGFQAAQSAIGNLQSSMSNAVTSIALNGTTNSPTAGQVDLGTLVTALQDSGSVGGTNRTATLAYDFTNNWWTTTVTDD